MAKRRSARALQLLILSLLALCLLGTGKPPWRARRRPDIRHNRLAALRVQPQDWMAEPSSPASVDGERLGRAVREICGWMPKRRSRDYARWILESSGEFDVDPFLLAALVYRESRCRSDKEELGGVGLTLLAPRMYQGHFKGRDYHYWVQQDGSWVKRIKPFPRFGFRMGRLLNAQSNLYLSAGLLAAWREQHDAVDSHFEQAPHRHFVSHWVWGDRVRSGRAEDRILTDRRRLLEYYGERQAPAPIEREGVRWYSPLDGAPRVVSSGLGSTRDSGRRHRGIDLESEFGEPVRALADGRVTFSGVDLPGSHHNQILSSAVTNEYERGALGRGGRYLCLRHDRATGGSLSSCYMHLETVEVEAGATVKGGQRIGSVGRTGMKRSSPHLHLEVHSSDTLYDPLQLLRGHVIGDPVEWKEPRRRRRPEANR